MPGRDWQADWELCQHQEIKQLPRLAWREIEKLNVGSWQVKATILAITYLDKALEGWPVALEERTRLEARVKELEAIIELCIEIECPQCFAYGPDVFGNSYCNKEKSSDCGIYKLKEVLNGA